MDYKVKNENIVIEQKVLYNNGKNIFLIINFT